MFYYRLEKMLIEAILGTGRPSNKVEPIETGKTTPILEKKLEGNGWIEEVKEEKFDENTKV